MPPSFFKKLGPINICDIKSLISCETINITKDDYFTDFVSLNKVNENHLTFIYDNEPLKGRLPINSGLVCGKNKIKDINSNDKAIIVDNVQESVAKISNIFYREYDEIEKNCFKKPILGDNCVLGKNVIIENGVVIGNNVNIDHGAIIKQNCIIGDNSKIGSNAVISNSILGENVYIGSNSSIGQRGFGFYLNKEKNINIFHSGGVILKTNVSIGSGCTIDRGSFSDTIIGENSYLDNLCHIAHNVEIGNNSAFAAMTGIAGSAKIGNNVLTGGQTGIAGHIKIGNNVQIAAKSGVFQSLEDGVSVMGNPAINKYKFIKTYKKNYGKK